MEFRDFFLKLPADQREAYAKRAGSTVRYLNQVAYGHKKAGLAFAAELVKASDGALTMGDIPMSDDTRALHASLTGGQVAQTQGAA